MCQLLNRILGESFEDRCERLGWTAMEYLLPPGSIASVWGFAMGYRVHGESLKPHLLILDRNFRVGALTHLRQRNVISPGDEDAILVAIPDLQRVDPFCIDPVETAARPCHRQQQQPDDINDERAEKASGSAPPGTPKRPRVSEDS